MYGEPSRCNSIPSQFDWVPEKATLTRHKFVQLGRSRSKQPFGSEAPLFVEYDECNEVKRLRKGGSVGFVSVGTSVCIGVCLFLSVFFHSDVRT